MSGEMIGVTGTPIEATMDGTRMGGVDTMTGSLTIGKALVMIPNGVMTRPLTLHGESIAPQHLAVAVAVTHHRSGSVWQTASPALSIRC